MRLAGLLLASAGNREAGRHDLAAGAGKPGHGVRRLRLRRPACRASAGRRRLARPRRGAPARSCRASATDGRGRPDPCRAGQRALSRQRSPRGRGRRRGGEPGRHPRQVGTADLPGRARGRRPRHCRGGPRGRRQDPGARVGHRRRQAIEGQLCAHEGGGRGCRAGAVPGCRDPAPLSRVRAGGPAVQSVRRHGAASRRSCR